MLLSAYECGFCPMAGAPSFSLGQTPHSCTAVIATEGWLLGTPKYPSNQMLGRENCGNDSFETWCMAQASVLTHTAASRGPGKFVLAPIEGQT